MTTMATTNINNPCLFIELDEAERKREICMDLRDATPPEEALLRNVHSIVIHEGDSVETVDTEKVLLQLALALQSHHQGPLKLNFDRCQVLQELGPLYAIAASRQPSDSLLLALHIEECKIKFRTARTLCRLLEMDLIGDLSFYDCTIGRQARDALDESLVKNKSLRRFRVLCFGDPKEHLLQGVQGLLRINPNLETLILRLPEEADDDDDKQENSCWNLFRATQTNESLKSLELKNSHVGLSAMEALMMMVLTKESLLHLHFQECTLSQSALVFMNLTLSKHHVLESLVVEDCDMVENCHMVEDCDIRTMHFSISLGNVRVQNLSVHQTLFTSQALSQMIDDVGNNALLRSWNVTGQVLDTQPGFDSVCRVLLRQNRGPAELSLDGDRFWSDLMVESLRDNSSLKALTVRDTTGTDLLWLVKGLAQMRHLEKLSLRLCYDCELSEEFFQTLESSLKQNATLHSLAIFGVVIEKELAKRYLPKIRYYLAINRIRRHALLREPTPDGLWAHVLSKTSSEAEGIHFLLTGKPDIVTMAPSRKRKVRDEH